MNNPTPDEIKKHRRAAGLTQREAAEIVYSAHRTWQDWERGIAKMHPAVWELFIHKTPTVNDLKTGDSK